MATSSCPICEDAAMDDQALSDLITWVMAQEIASLPHHLVPGTSDDERRALAALGGVAWTLAEGVSPSWPEEVRAWMEEAPRPPNSLIKTVRPTLADRDDVLARCYEHIVTGRNRRRLGTFFTPPAVVEFMLDHSESVMGTPATIVDPGAGVGAFTLAARRRWPTSRVVAVDINLVTLGLLATRCQVEHVADVELVLDNYLSWTAKGYQELDLPRLTIGNPPYTRHQDLKDKAKKQVAMDAGGDLISSGLAGLSTYFLAAALNALEDQDSLCLLLSGTWTEARYGREVREALWKEAHRLTEFRAFPPDLVVFPGTRVTAMTLLLGPVKDQAQPMTTATALPDSNGVRTINVRSRTRRGPVPETLGTWLWPRPPSTRKSQLALGEIAQVRRGVATGANRFFFLTDAARDGLPGGTTIPALVRLRHVRGRVLDKIAHDEIGRQGLQRWLLFLDDEALVQDPRVQTLLETGVKAGLPDRYLLSDRDPWYRVETVRPPDLFVSPMSKALFRAVPNEVGAVHSNSLYGLYLRDNFLTLSFRDSPGLARCVTNYLNNDEGQRAIRAQGRHYGHGLIKLEPGNLLSVVIPPPEVLVVEFGEPNTVTTN
jgi:adenine-specific DNA-methyltransferase